MARKLATAHGLGHDDLIVPRRDPEELQGLSVRTASRS